MHPTTRRGHIRHYRRVIIKWMTPGLRIKRWLVLLMFGITVLAVGLAQAIVSIYREADLPAFLYMVTLRFMPEWARIASAAIIGVSAIGIGLYGLNRSILAPFILRSHESLIDVVYAHNRRQRGIKVVAIGGGTGLPAVLRGLKAFTNNITAIVTVADDGGSSGKLRRELGVVPPGDLRNNIAALANDEDLITQLFQYRFAEGGLEGHSFGNLFLTAMANITGSMDRAVAETGRVLAVEGRVLPSTLQDDVTLMAEVRVPGESRLRRVSGESSITGTGGTIERVFLYPDQVRAYPETIRAILNAHLIVIGPGSLFTSILPNLLVNGIVEAIRASRAYTVYVCNVAMQPGETDGFMLVDHILALEAHIGRGVFDAVLGNGHYPTLNEGQQPQFVRQEPKHHAAYERYDIHLADLTDGERPWRHDPKKLAQALLAMYSSITQAVPSQNGAVIAAS
ncbi:MAG: YvcK family protein [Chloroflexi bacterium]|nr:YvcK family protein [Chloroflexota bacterium]